MDVKQFNLFQATVQFAVDETKKQRAGEGPSHFEMGSWFSFNLNAEERGITFRPIVDVPGLEAYSIVEGISVGTCGTTACMAGTAVFLNGSDRLVVDTDAISEADGSAYVVTEDGHMALIRDRAQDLLGLNSGEASKLFHMTTRTIETIVEYCEQLARGYGYKMEVVW